MGKLSKKRGPDPLSSEELAKRGSHRAGRRKAEERGEIGRKKFVVKKSPARAPMPGDEFPWGDERRDSIEAWLPLLLELPKWDPRWQAKGYRFDGRKARRAIGWIERNVYHLKGSRRGQLVRLDPWQRAFVANLFGWVVDGGARDGRRRFLRALLYIAKKNGKSTLTGALAVYAFVRLKEGGAKVLTAATHRGQAREVWEVAQDVILANPRIEKLCVVWNSKINLVRDRTAVLEPISGEASGEDGADCSFAILDELHRQNDAKLLTVLAEGGSAREEPVFVMLTTADEIRESPCNSVLVEANAIRLNRGDEIGAGWNPTFLPAIYEMDDGDDWRDEKNWRKANPGLGTVKSLEVMRSSYLTAIADPAAAVEFKRFHLNLRVQPVIAPINLDFWVRLAGPVGWLELRQKMLGRPCILGVDLAETSDMVSVVQWFWQEKVIVPWYWASERAANELAKAQKPMYLRWRDAGALDIVPGNAIELLPIVERIEDLRAAYKIVAVGMDRYKALEMGLYVDRLKLEINYVEQNWKHMTEPCDRLVRMVDNHATSGLRHGGHPVLTWNMQNLRFLVTGQRGKKPQKASAAQKIDGAAALLDAIAMEGVAAKATKGSVYETRGPIVA